MPGDFWAAILAGGSGTRFWPLSRHRRPKQLLNVLGEAGGRSMLRQSVERVLPLTGPERLLVVTGQVHGQAVRETLPDIPAANIVMEPTGRNTAPACGLAAWFARRASGEGAWREAVMAVLPADHLIADEAAFRDDLRAAAQAARSVRRLITFGLKPHRPETGYGYLERGGRLGEFDGRTVFELASFREKPDLATARGYLAAGSYFWNAGIFVWGVEDILTEIGRHMPELSAGLERLAPALLTQGQAEAMSRIYPTLPRQSIDYGVMEPSSRKAMLPAGFAWSDLGSWETVHELADKDSQGNAVVGGGTVLPLDASGCLVDAPGKLVALLGVKNLVVVETADAILVMERGRAQDVGKIVDGLRATGREDLL